MAARAGATRLGATVYELDPGAQADFAALDLDAAVVAAYGLILPRPILEAPRRGCLNVHASLLPRWRGAAPIQRAILAGDGTTGVTIMRMEEGLDTGPMLLRQSIPIGDYDTTGDIAFRLSRLGAELMVRWLADPLGYPAQVQPETGATYAAKIDKSEARIDWRAGMVSVDRQIRALNPTPGAWFEYGGERIRVHVARIQSDPRDPNLGTDFPAEPGLVLDDDLAIGCGRGAIRPVTVQRSGRAPMSAAELLRGFPIPRGARIG